MRAGRKDREHRIVESLGGGWGTSSQDFARLARMLFEQSREYANNVDGNCSIYTLSAIPMLFSALRCLLIELNTGLLSDSGSVPASVLARSSNDIVAILDNYPIKDSLTEDLQLLVEVRNEIIHPSHRPTGTADRTPAYLGRLRELKLLQVSESGGDYLWLSQLQSHRLLEWSFATIQDTVIALLDAHRVDDECFAGIVASYSAPMG